MKMKVFYYFLGIYCDPKVLENGSAPSKCKVALINDFTVYILIRKLDFQTAYLLIHRPPFLFVIIFNLI